MLSCWAWTLLLSASASLCSLEAPLCFRMQHMEMKTAIRVRELTEKEYWALGPKPVQCCFLIIREK
ncbi:hypothetical protein MtrunA17_Chr3g0086591 [Medicago truncatula]|uniref:Transmembrane protein n=1 Tax=Medicago truncatula TaxID=3880 RepID=A0A396INA6_MEDTR|nr:hypothetical protein MtrunA17_Chr3g0086591 [Medicago truncatula]